MQSNNPVFRKNEEFSRAGGGPGIQGDPSTWGVGQPGGSAYGAPPQTTSGPMTVDTVVQKTAISLAVVVVTAMATWVLTPDLDVDPNAMGTVGALALVGTLAAFGLSMVNSFKRSISPALVLAFAVAEGIAMGAISKVFDGMYPGVVMNAVVGTFAAFAGTLAAYKFFNIKVTDKFRRGVIAAGFGMVALSLLELVLSAFGAPIGLFGNGGLGLLFAIAGLVLGIFFLMLDFDFVEQGVANRIPEVESWRAAFGLTLSLVYIYVNLLRIMSILSDN